MNIYIESLMIIRELLVITMFKSFFRKYSFLLKKLYMSYLDFYPMSYLLKTMSFLLRINMVITYMQNSFANNVQAFRRYLP